MQNKKLWRRLLGLSRASVEDVTIDEDSGVVVSVRAHRSESRRCGRCRRPSPLYDRGAGRRRWRSLDLGTQRVWLEADAPRVRCRVHGPTVAAVPWARHDAGHTRDFDDMVAWLAVQCSKTAVTELMRIAWRTVGAIITRVQADSDVDRLAGLRRIGIDEISYKRGHRYLTVVVDHDTGRLVWAAPGRDRATLRRFFDELGNERASHITHVSADAAPWIRAVVKERCPDAILSADPFHVVAWATDCLDQVRRHVLRQQGGWAPQIATLRRADRPAVAHPVKQSMWALRKNPENMTDRQRAQLAWVATTHPVLHRAYLLKEGLRAVFTVKGEAGKQALDGWISWARRCRIPQFVDLARRVVKHRAEIDAALDTGLSQGLIESTNTKIRRLTRLAYGFKNPEALIALALLALSGTNLTLPGRR